MHNSIECAIEAIAIILILFGAHMDQSNKIFSLMIKYISPIMLTTKSRITLTIRPRIMLTSIDLVVQSPLSMITFWCPFLDTHLTAHHLHIGVQLK